MEDKSAPLSQLKQLTITCSFHTRPVVSLRFSDITEHSYYLVTASKDGQCQLLNGDTGDWVGTLLGHKGAVWSAVLNSDATRIATGAADFSAKLWDALTGEELHSFEHKHIVKCVDFDRSCGRLLTGSNERLLRLFDLANCDSPPIELPGHAKSLRAAVFLGDNLVASAGDDKRFVVRDLRTREPALDKELPSCPSDLQLRVADSRLLLCYGSQVTVWDSDKLCELSSHQLPCPIYSAALHPTESEFVCGGADFVLYKCSAIDGGIIESHKGHFGPVHCVRYSPDGRLYASGSEDGTLRLWQHKIGETYGLWRMLDSQQQRVDDSLPVASVEDETAVA